MNVYDQAHSLAQAIKQSGEFMQYDQLKKQVDANPELSQAVNDFQAKQIEMQTRQLSGEQLGPEYMQQIQQLYAIMIKDPLAAQYMEAQMRLSLMMTDVYQIIGEAIGMGDLQESIGKAIKM